MKVMRLLTVLFSILTVMFLGTIAGASTTAAPDAGPCAPGTAYDPACDVDHNGQIIHQHGQRRCGTGCDLCPESA